MRKKWVHSPFVTFTHVDFLLYTMHTNTGMLTITWAKWEAPMWKAAWLKPAKYKYYHLHRLMVGWMAGWLLFWKHVVTLSRDRKEQSIKNVTEPFVNWGVFVMCFFSVHSTILIMYAIERVCHSRQPANQWLWARLSNCFHQHHHRRTHEETRSWITGFTCYVHLMRGHNS